MYYPLLTTINRLRSLDLASSNTADDDKLRRLILVAGQTFSNLVGSRLAPYRDVKYYNHPYPMTNVLKLNDNLLEIIECKTENGDVTLDNADLILKCGDNTNLTPYDTIEIKTTSDDVFFNIGQTAQNSNIVTGIWGWHDELDNMWVNTSDTVVNSTSTTITVADADGLNSIFETRFEKMQLCKVVQGTSFEFIVVVNLDTVTNVLTVIRGVNGTSALTLTGGELIYSYNPPYDIEQAVRRLTAWYYRAKDSQRADLDRPMITNVGVVMPPHLPKDVLELALSLRNPLRG